MAFQPGPGIGLLVLAALYVRATRVLSRRGFHIPAGQQAYWWTGFAFMVGAFFSPLDIKAERVVWAHMAQHTLMADVGAPLMLIGLRNPMLQFFLPRRILVPLARRRALRRFFARIRKPMWAVPIYTLVLYGWHLGPTFTAALRNDFIHGLQHESFIVFGALAWWPLVEPARRHMPSDLWKIPYIIAARLPTMFLGMGFIVAQTPFYASFYGTGTRLGGISALEDQQIGGAIMMMVDVITLMVVLSVIFWRAARDDEAANAVVDATSAPVGETKPLSA